jgi:CRP-like cAMP-binding protein
MPFYIRQLRIDQKAGVPIGKYLTATRTSDWTRKLLTRPYADAVTILPGRTAFSIGSAIDAIWVLVSGTACVEFERSKMIPKGRLAGPGEVFGVTELLTRSVHSSSLRAISRCGFYRIRSDTMFDRLLHDVQFRTGLIRELATAYVQAVRPSGR